MKWELISSFCFDIFGTLLVNVRTEKTETKKSKNRKNQYFDRKTSQLSFASIFSPIGPKLDELDLNYCKLLDFLTISRFSYVLAIFGDFAIFGSVFGKDFTLRGWCEPQKC